MPFPCVSNSAIPDGSTDNLADKAVDFYKSIKRFPPSSTDLQAQENLRHNIHGSSSSHRVMHSLPPPWGHSRKSLHVDAFVRLWEHQLTESRCKLLVAAPEVAGAAQSLGDKLSLPICILQIPREERFSRQNGEKLLMENDVNSLVTMYVRDVPHCTRKTSLNVTRWKAVQLTANEEIQKLTQPLGSTDEASRAAMLFYENAGLNSSKVVVYTHEALERQVVRNKRLLGLTPADAVAIVAPDYTAKEYTTHGAASTLESSSTGAEPRSYGRMTCAPKGLLAVALPAVAAGASLSILTSPTSERPLDARHTAARLQQLAARLPGQQMRFPTEANCENGLAFSGRAACRHSRDPRALNADTASVEGLWLWEALAGMQTDMLKWTGSASRATKIPRQPLADEHDIQMMSGCGVTVLAVDLKTAAAMLTILRPRDKGLLHPVEEEVSIPLKAQEPAGDGGDVEGDHGSSPLPKFDFMYQFSGTCRLTEDRARGYLDAAKALRLVCICTDEEDLDEQLDCGQDRMARSGRSGTNFARINAIVRGWQQLVPSRVKVLHLCSLTEVGLLLWNDGRGIENPKGISGPAKTRDAPFAAIGKNKLSPQRQPKEATWDIGPEKNELTTLGGIAPYDVKAQSDCESGLLKITSPHGASGYYNRPRSSAEAFGIRGVFNSFLQGRVFADVDDTGLAASSSPPSDRLVLLQSPRLRTSASPAPFLYRVATWLQTGPKMERHIEGWVKKIPVCGKDWCNLHAPKRHRRQVFR